MMRCSVCSSHGFTESAHIESKSRYDASENDKIFNILPICPTCHYYFDTCKAFTLHHEWKCWVFSDKRQYVSSNNITFENPFRSFYYAYPPKFLQRKVNKINIEQINANQMNEFSVVGEGSAANFFLTLEKILIKKNRWDFQLNRPKRREISVDYTVKDYD